MTTAILRASAWDQAAQAKAIPPRLHNLIADNEKILTKILNTSRMELEAVAKTYKNPAELEQILRALINRGFITTDTHSEDITRFKSNVGSAFEIGLSQGPTPANPAVMSIIQETMVNSAVNYITKLDSDLKMQLGQIMADGYKNKVFPTDIVKQMSERVGITQGRAGMIARTETMRSSNIANWSQAKANGQKYFIVDHRGAACIYCKQIASKGVFSIDETRYVPPYHPNCACVPIFFDDKADAKDYLDRVMKRNELEIKEMKRQGYKIPKDGTGINLTGDEQTKIIKKVAKKPTTTPKTSTTKTVKPYSSTDALIKYQAEGAYRPLNKNLRKGKKLTTEDMKVDAGLQKAMKPLEKDIRVYRGLGKTAGKDIQEANFLGIIQDNGYTSTSTVRSVAHQGSFQMGWKAEIVLPKGTKVVDVNKTMGKKSVIPEEHEIIVNKGTKYGISDIDENKHTVTLVALEGKVNSKNFVTMDYVVK